VDLRQNNKKRLITPSWFVPEALRRIEIIWLFSALPKSFGHPAGFDLGTSDHWKQKKPASAGFYLRAS
jgi:hypothetical protein